MGPRGLPVPVEGSQCILRSPSAPGFSKACAVVEAVMWYNDIWSGGQGLATVETMTVDECQVEVERSTM